MADRKLFPNSVTALPDEGLTPNGLVVHAAEPDQRTKTMTLLFAVGVPPDARAELEERVAKGEVIPPAEITQKYASSEADLEALTKWLQNEGFSIEQVSSD